MTEQTIYNESMRLSAVQLAGEWASEWALPAEVQWTPEDIIDVAGQIYDFITGKNDD